MSSLPRCLRERIAEAWILLAVPVFEVFDLVDPKPTGVLLDECSYSARPEIRK